MKVTVFNGSPRGSKSNSHRIVAPLLEGAREAGAETKEIFLVEHDVKYCRGCFSCWGQTPGKCVINDDMSRFINIFLESDYVGMATPVYGQYMTGILKIFNERLLPLATPHIRKNEDGSFYHNGRVKRFPRQFFIANSGFPGEHNFNLLEAAMAHQQLVLKVFRNCGESLNEPDPNGSEYQKIKEFYSALREAGYEMVKNGCVSDENVKKIHAELISDEEYMASANQYWDQKIEEAESVD